MNVINVGSYYKCPRCGNDDPAKLGWNNGKVYCRNCISFRGQTISYTEQKSRPSTIYLPYSLSEEQQMLSDSLVRNYIGGKSTLVHAVCGSGKTEIVLSSISYVLSQGGTVGFAIPRRDVVIEIYDRLRCIFKDSSVTAVYGGHTSNLYADIICLTTHQLYRYEDYFDLLILDEIDAFPYAGNDVLNAMFFRSIKGHFIQMSATASDKTIEFFSQDGYEILTLNSRYHGYPLPVPKIYAKKLFLKYIFLIQKLREFQKLGKPVFVFTPTIAICEEIYSIIKPFVKKVNYVHSKKPDRAETIQAFKDGKLKILVTTAVLERGVTLKDLQVIIFNSDHKLYDSAALIQISGRVGRKRDAPTGEVIFICEKPNSEMEKCIREIK